MHGAQVCLFDLLPLLFFLGVQANLFNLIGLRVLVLRSMELANCEVVGIFRAFWAEYERLLLVLRPDVAFFVSAADDWLAREQGTVFLNDVNRPEVLERKVYVALNDMLIVPVLALVLSKTSVVLEQSVVFVLIGQLEAYLHLVLGLEVLVILHDLHLVALLALVLRHHRSGFDLVEGSVVLD